MNDADRPAPRRGRLRLAIGVAIAILIGAAALGAPAFRRWRADRARAELISDILRVRHDPSGAELLGVAPELVPLLFDGVAPGATSPYRSNYMALLWRAWALQALSPEQSRRLVASAAGLQIMLRRRRWPQDERRALYVSTAGPWSESAPVDTARGVLTVRVSGAGEPIAERALEGAMANDVAWRDQIFVDLSEACAAPGVYAIEARLALEILADGKVVGEGELVERAEIEVVEGDWRGVVELLDGAETAAEVRGALDVQFGVWPKIEPDIRIDAGARNVTFWVATDRAFPFWIWHAVTIERDGQAIVRGGIATARPGEVKRLPGAKPSMSFALSVADGVELAPGRYPVTVRLRPAAQSLLSAIDGELRLFGGELTFERTLIVAAPRDD